MQNNNFAFEQYLYKRSQKNFNKYAGIPIALLDNELKQLSLPRQRPRLDLETVSQIKPHDVAFIFIDVRELIDRAKDVWFRGDEIRETLLLSQPRADDDWMTLLYCFIATILDGEGCALFPIERVFILIVAMTLYKKHFTKLQNDKSDFWVARRLLIVSLGTSGFCEQDVVDLAIPELKSLLTKQSDETIMKQLCDSDMVAGLLTCRAMTQEGAGYYTFTDAEMKDPKVLVRLQQVAADYVSAAANLQPAPRRSPLAAYLEVLHCGRHVTPPVVEKIFASGEMFARDSMKWATAAPLRSLSRVVALRISLIASVLHSLRKFRALNPDSRTYIESCIQIRQIYYNAHELYLEAARDAQLYFDLSPFPLNSLVVVISERIITGETRCTFCRVLCSKFHPLKVCSRCSTVWYCSEECQQLDWKELKHKTVCDIIRTSGATDPSYLKNTVVEFK